MILALNTAQTPHELALLDGDRLLAERRWENVKEDLSKFVPRLEELLDEAGVTKAQLTDLVVVRGPGSFTSVRVGVAFMNALAEGLRAIAPSTAPVRLYALDTFELITRKAATADPLVVVMQAGGLDVGVRWKNEIKVGPIASLLAEIPHDHSTKVAAELSETQNDELRAIALEKDWHILEAHELQTLGQALVTGGLTGLEPVDSTLPLYLKGAYITVSADPWKRVK